MLQEHTTCAKKPYLRENVPLSNKVRLQIEGKIIYLISAPGSMWEFCRKGTKAYYITLK